MEKELKFAVISTHEDDFKNWLSDRHITGEAMKFFTMINSVDGVRGRSYVGVFTTPNSFNLKDSHEIYEEVLRRIEN